MIAQCASLKNVFCDGAGVPRLRYYRWNPATGETEWNVVHGRGQSRPSAAVLLRGQGDVGAKF